jgi:hypothetical protein
MQELLRTYGHCFVELENDMRGGTKRRDIFFLRQAVACDCPDGTQDTYRLKDLTKMHILCPKDNTYLDSDIALNWTCIKG